MNAAGGPVNVLSPSTSESLARLGTNGADTTILSAVILFDSVRASVFN